MKSVDANTSAPTLTSTFSSDFFFLCMPVYAIMGGHQSKLRLQEKSSAGARSILRQRKHVRSKPV